MVVVLSMTGTAVASGTMPTRVMMIPMVLLAVLAVRVVLVPTAPLRRTPPPRATGLGSVAALGCDTTPLTARVPIVPTLVGRRAVLSATSSCTARVMRLVAGAGRRSDDGSPGRRVVVAIVAVGPVIHGRAGSHVGVPRGVPAVPRPATRHWPGAIWIERIGTRRGVFCHRPRPFALRSNGRSVVNPSSNRPAHHIYVAPRTPLARWPLLIPHRV